MKDCVIFTVCVCGGWDCCCCDSVQRLYESPNSCVLHILLDAYRGERKWESNNKNNVGIDAGPARHRRHYTHAALYALCVCVCVCMYFFFCLEGRIKRITTQSAAEQHIHPARINQSKYVQQQHKFEKKYSDTLTVASPLKSNVKCRRRSIQ